jgi:hypothetical protein
MTYANTLSFEIGYYRLNLEKLKETCCRGDSDREKASVSCFWAGENREDKVETQISKLMIPVVIEE